MRPLLRTAIPSALIALAALIPGSQALAGPTPPPPPTVSVTGTLGPSYCELFGQTAPSLKLSITHTTSSGVKKAVYKVQSDGTTGEWIAPCTDKGLVPGDRLIITTRPDGLAVRTIVVPVMSLAINRVTNAVTGQVRGDAGLLLTECSVGTCADTWGMGVNQNKDRTFALTYDKPLDGLDSLHLRTLVGNDEWELTRSVPRVELRRGRATVSGYARRPGASVTVTVTRGATVATFKGTAGPDAFFTGTIKRNGVKFPIAGGDVVTSSVATDVTLTVPSAPLVVTGEEVSGTCYADQEVLGSAVSADNSVQSYSRLFANGSGFFSGDVNAAPGLIVSAECQTAAGDKVTLRMIAP